LVYCSSEITMRHEIRYFAVLVILLVGFSVAAVAAEGDGQGSGQGDGKNQGSGKGKKNRLDGKVSSDTGAEDSVLRKGNWKKGRIYFRMVCTECHVREAGNKIAPMEKTKAEWIAYFDRNIHGPQDGPTKYTASYFVSREFRESIKNTNRAAKKLLKIPADQLLADVRAFLVHTAKDSDQPTSCE